MLDTTTIYYLDISIVQIKIALNLIEYKGFFILSRSFVVGY